VGEHAFQAWYKEISHYGLVETISHYKASTNRQVINKAVDSLFEAIEPHRSKGDLGGVLERKIMQIVMDNRLRMSMLLYYLLLLMQIIAFVQGS